jgi:enoyl-[acyl-carrier protein] reductase II
MAAALALGASGVQVGTRFAVTRESSAHDVYKEMAVAAGSSDTKLLLKKLVPTRMLVNDFASRVMQAEQQGVGEEELRRLHGQGRSRAGIFEGDRQEGEIEIGMCSAMVRDIPDAAHVVHDMVRDCRTVASIFSNL